MNNKDLKLLKELLSLQTTYDDTKEFDEWLEKQSFKNTVVDRDVSGNWYLTKGTSDTYPCVVAHVDRVCNKKENERHIIQINDVLLAVNGDGKQIDVFGDDTSGVFVAIKALQELNYVKVVFFWGEESGMQGSKQADMDFFKDCRFVIQCDRKHDTADFITYTNGVETCSDNFLTACTSYMGKYGYKKANGVATDIGQLVKNGLSVCAVNLSAGYYNAHSNQGIIKISKLEDSLNLTLDICKNITDVYIREVKSEPVFEYSEFDIWTPEVPKKYQASKYGKEAFEAGWNEILQKIINLNEVDYEMAMVYLDEARDQRIEMEMYNGTVDITKCSKFECWPSLVPDFDFDNTPIYSCIKCNKTFERDQPKQKTLWDDIDFNY